MPKIVPNTWNREQFKLMLKTLCVNSSDWAPGCFLLLTSLSLSLTHPHSHTHTQCLSLSRFVSLCLSLSFCFKGIFTNFNSDIKITNDAFNVFLLSLSKITPDFIVFDFLCVCLLLLRLSFLRLIYLLHQWLVPWEDLEHRRRQLLPICR